MCGNAENKLCNFHHNHEDRDNHDDTWSGNPTGLSGSWTVDYSDERGNSLTLLVPESAAPTRRWRTKARQIYTHWCCEEASVLKVFATDCSRTIWRLRFCSLCCTTSTTLEPRVLAIRLLGTYSEVRDIDPGCSSDRCAGTYREFKGHSFNG